MYRIAVKNTNRICGFLPGTFSGRFGTVINHRPTSSTTPTASSANMAAVAERVVKEPFLNGSSSVYVEEMYKSWLQDPKSVHKSWDVFFRVSQNSEPGYAYQPVPNLTLPSIAVQQDNLIQDIRSAVTTHSLRDIEDHLSVQAIIRSYQVKNLFVHY